MSQIDIHIAQSVDGKKRKVFTNKPVMFLAGPIRNAPKWHEEALRYLLGKESDTFVAVPIRTLPNDLHHRLVDDMGTELFERQRSWELYYLGEASRKGCIVFWLPKESSVKEFEDKVYAHITMMELVAAIAGKVQHGPQLNLVVGTDGEFPEWNTIKLDLETALSLAGWENEKIPICYSLEDTLDTALKLIYG